MSDVGHLDFLDEARKQGDFLIVGIHTDPVSSYSLTLSILCMSTCVKVLLLNNFMKENSSFCPRNKKGRRVFTFPAVCLCICTLAHPYILASGYHKVLEVLHILHNDTDESSFTLWFKKSLFF